MTDSIERAVFAWLQGCPAARALFSAVGRAEPSGAVFVPEGDAAVCRFLRGTERQFRFSLKRFELFMESPNEDANLVAFERARAVGAWIEEQDAAGNLPRLPAGCSVTGLTVEGVTGADFNNGRCACVTLDVLIDYFKEE